MEWVYILLGFFGGIVFTIISAFAIANKFGGK
jgi:hypothetical protein